MKFSLVCFGGRVLALLLFGSVVAAQESAMDVVPLYYRSAAEIQPLLLPLLESSDRIIDNGSSLIVKTAPGRLQSIQALIKKLDAPLHNLQLTVLQTRSKTAQQLNVAAGVAVVVPDPLLRGGGYAADTRSLGSDEATQTVRTLDGQPAMIKTGSIRRVQNAGLYETGYGAGLYSQSYPLEISTGFEVLPRLAGEQAIVELAPWSDDMTNSGAIQTRNAVTTLRVRLGEWVQIGGSDEQVAEENRGFSSYSHSTRQQGQRILLKVEKIK